MGYKRNNKRGVGIESDFLNEYKTENGLDEDKMEEDLKILMFQIVLKEQKLSEIMEQNKTSKFKEQILDISVQYLKDRKELTEKYIEKIRQTEKEN